MADDLTGQWGTVTFQIPDFLKGIRETVNNFAELLVTYLEIANTFLDFVKAFVRGFLDPLVAIIEAIIEEILAFLRDLKQIGLYITGDWELLGWPPEDLKGGFQNYERRMIARLADRTDPTRPNVSSATKVLALFSYLSVDTSDLERLINYITSLMKVFGLSFFPDTSRLPIPVIQSTKYSTNIFNFSSMSETLNTFNGTPPQKTRVTWVAQLPSQKSPLNPFPVLGPSGFIVTVSTLPDGLAIKYARPKSTTERKGADGNVNRQAQPREYGVVRDANGQPLFLHGGAEMLSFQGSGFEYNKGLNSSTTVPADGYCQVFGTLNPASNEVVTLETLGPDTPGLGTPGDGRGSDFLLQRTFLIAGSGVLAQWFAGEYSEVFDLEDMPHQARWVKNADGTYTPVGDGPAATYYIRVWSVGSQVAKGEAVPKWDFKTPKYQAATLGQPFVVDLMSGPASLGNPSEPRKVSFVGRYTQDYLKALQTALLVLVLTRSDLPLLSEVVALKGDALAEGYESGLWTSDKLATRPTGLEDSRTVFSLLFPESNTLEIAGQNPLKWRSDLYQNVRRVSLDIYAKTSPNDRLERTVVEACQDLLNCTVGEALDSVDPAMGATWRLYLNGRPDVTLLESFNPENPVNQSLLFGFAPNPQSSGLETGQLEELFFVEGSLLGRETDFQMISDSGPEIVVAESNPNIVQEILSLVGEGLRRIYEKFIQADGSLFVPDEYRSALTEKTRGVQQKSSGDMTPVFVVSLDQLATFDRSGSHLLTLPDSSYPGLVFTRGLLRTARGDQNPVLTQAAFALRTAGAQKVAGDGEWIAIRLFDTWPELEEFLRSLENWVKALAESVRSIADAIIKYINFIQSQIVELQQLIRRINALIQSFLGFAFALPQFSGLLLVSDGTDGVLADLVSATNKPSDSPLSYGAGIALLVPFAPSFMVDIISVIAGGQDLSKKTPVARPPDAIGVEAVAPEPGEPPSDEPDVL